MTRFRPTLTYEIDFGLGGDYFDPRSDVTSAVDSDLRVLFGTAKTSNPDRPILKPLTGSLTLMGAAYAPRVSTEFTPAQLRLRKRFRARWSDGADTLTLFECWIQSPRIQEPRAGTRLTRYTLEGFLLEDMRRSVSVLQLADNATTVTARTLVEQAFGEILDSYTFDPTPLTIFQFTGKAGEFASRFGTVAGAFPIEHSNGGLGLHSPLASPAGQEDIATPDYVLADLKSDWLDEFIRNYADVLFFNPEIDRVTYTQEHEYIGDGAQDLPAFTVRLPALATGRRYDKIAATVDREAAHVLLWFRATPLSPGIRRRHGLPKGL